jgi:fructuronate reductase
VLDWLAGSVGFPDIIVDRIVPATTDRDREAAAAALGVRDDMAVVGEPYRQWVLEDAFVAARPQWELDGALVVPDVAPYQLMKLRLLNGSHSAMAYLGAAAGCATVADVLASEWGEPLVRAFGAEVAPTLPDAGPDAKRYVDDLVARFRNPAMHHLLRQIGSDGSLKIPERWFPALRELRASGAATPVLELALAAWVTATRPGADHRMTDPTGAALNRCWTTPDPRTLVGALLRTVGATDLAEQADLTASVAARLPALRAGRIEL